MLPANPQKINNLFFNSLSAYKKIFISMLPFSIGLGVIQTGPQMIHSFLQSSSVWLIFVIIIPMVFLNIFCFSWAICFIYEFLDKHQVNYRGSFVTALQRFLRAHIFFFSVAAVVGAIMGIAGYFLSGFHIDGFFKEHQVLGVIFWTVIAIFAYYTFLIGVVYTFDVLLKNSKILVAMKKAVKIAFRAENAWRTGALIMLFMFVALISMGIVFVLSFINLAMNSVISDKILVLLATILIFPLNLTIMVHFYHDLMLRFEKRSY